MNNENQSFKFEYEGSGKQTTVDGKIWGRTIKEKSVFLKLVNPDNSMCRECPFSQLAYNNLKSGKGMRGIIECSQMSVVGKRKEAKMRISFSQNVEPDIIFNSLAPNFIEKAKCAKNSNIREVIDQAGTDIIENRFKDKNI